MIWNMITSNHTNSRAPQPRIAPTDHKNRIAKTAGVTSLSAVLFLGLIAGQLALTASIRAADPVVRPTADAFSDDRIDISRAKPVRRQDDQDSRIVRHGSVSYTHLTLPTTDVVWWWGWGGGG